MFCGGQELYSGDRWRGLFPGCGDFTGAQAPKGTSKSGTIGRPVCHVLPGSTHVDARLFRPADPIDPAYGRELRTAVLKGVEMMVYDVILDLEGIRLNQPLPYEI